MIVTIENTTRTADLDGNPARVWEGYSQSGIPVVCLMLRIAAPASADQERFCRELTATRPPSTEAIMAFPHRITGIRRERLETILSDQHIILTDEETEQLENVLIRASLRKAREQRR